MQSGTGIRHHTLKEGMQRRLHVHDSFVLIPLRRSANITEFNKYVVFLVGFERVGAPFLRRSYTEERLRTTLESPVVNDKITINKQLVSQIVYFGKLTNDGDM